MVNIRGSYRLANKRNLKGDRCELRAASLRTIPVL